MTGSRHDALSIRNGRPLGKQEFADRTDHLRCADDPSMSVAIGPEMTDMPRDTDVALRVADIDLLVVLRMHDEQWPIEPSRDGD